MTEDFRRLSSPWRTLLAVIAAVAVTETVVMLVLDFIPGLTVWTAAVLDALLLVCLVAPLLHKVIVQPLRTLLAQYESTRILLEKAQFGLTEKVRARTETLEKANALLRAEILVREGTERRLLEHEQLLDIISSAQRGFIDAPEDDQSFRRLLDAVVKLTGSECGFIYDVGKEQGDALRLRPRALSQDADVRTPTTGGPGRASMQAACPNVRGVFEALQRTYEPLIINEAVSDPRADELLAWCPLLHSFLGLPCRDQGQVVGVIGLCNRPSGYDLSLAQFLEPLVATVSSVLAANRLRDDRRPAEYAR